jgi:DNA-binding IclR family transcriptional regulator
MAIPENTIATGTRPVRRCCTPPAVAILLCVGGNAREQGRSTTSRVLALLGAFTPMRITLSLTDLARSAGLPVATAHRLAGELVAWGALERLPDGTYQIGMRLWRLGALAPGSRDLPMVAQRFMGDLHEATRQTVELAVPDGPGARIIDTVTGRHAASGRAATGGHLPLRTTAVGQVILAFSGSAATPGELARIRRDHVAYAAEEVAAPVFGRDGTLVAAIALVAHAGTDLRGFAMAVRTSALGITRTLTAGT